MTQKTERKRKPLKPKRRSRFHGMTKKERAMFATALFVKVQNAMDAAKPAVAFT